MIFPLVSLGWTGPRRILVLKAAFKIWSSSLPAYKCTEHSSQMSPILHPILWGVISVKISPQQDLHTEILHICTTVNCCWAWKLSSLGLYIFLADIAIVLLMAYASSLIRFSASYHSPEKILLLVSEVGLPRRPNAEFSRMDQHKHTVMFTSIWIHAKHVQKYWNARTACKMLFSFYVRLNTHKPCTKFWTARPRSPKNGYISLVSLFCLALCFLLDCGTPPVKQL